jgi:aminopeptidase N
LTNDAVLSSAEENSVDQGTHPIHYDLRLEVDLERSLFLGSVIIDIQAQGAVQSVELDLVELSVQRCAVGRKEPRPCEFHVDEQRKILHIVLPETCEGTLTCRVDFEGQLKDGMIGFYRSRYRLPDKSGYIAVTQFEESEARRTFPCFDHPSMKATFDVVLVVDEELMAVSNGPVEEEQPLGDGRKAVRFRRTPRMSTYLLFFGVGPFRTLTNAGRVEMRALAVADGIERARYGLEFGRRSLEFLEAYTGLPFPIPKLDLIGIPDFAFGAMENWGAITFRENLLLRDPGSTSRAGEERICEVIAHELAHQWFGNLVTPWTWNELWLNESFATYFGFYVLDTFFPEWEAWDRFLEGQVHTAMERDALRETLAVDIAEEESVKINASTAPIIYNKGGAVLRQLQACLGETEFREGVRTYLSSHAYDCASSRSAWKSLSNASSRPVEPMIREWVEQQGFPLVEARREGSRLVLSQERFTFLPLDSDTLWQIPIRVLLLEEDRSTRTVETVLEERTGSLDLGSSAAAFKVNFGQTGFYRVKYTDQEALERLGQAVEEHSLSACDRWGIQDDLYALLKRGDLTLQDYLAFVHHYRDEDAYLPLAGLGDNLHHAWLVFEESGCEQIATLALQLLEGALQRIGMEPKPGEALPVSRLRDQVLWQAGRFGSRKARAFGLDRFSALTEGGKVHPDILGAVLRTAAMELGEPAFEWFEDRLSRSQSEFERTIVLEAMGCFGDEDTVQRALGYVLERVPARNKFVPVARMAGNPRALPLLWDWYVKHFERIRGFHPLHHERIITYTVPMGGLGRESEVKRFLEAEVEKSGCVAGDVVRLSLEWLEVHQRMRARGAEAVRFKGERGPVSYDRLDAQSKRA